MASEADLKRGWKRHYKRNRYVTFRVSDAEYAMLHARAEKEGRSLSDSVRHRALGVSS